MGIRDKSRMNQSFWPEPLEGWSCHLGVFGVGKNQEMGLDMGSSELLLKAQKWMSSGHLYLQVWSQERAWQPVSFGNCHHLDGFFKLGKWVRSPRKKYRE